MTYLDRAAVVAMAAGLAAVLAVPASAQEIASVYTRIDQGCAQRQLDGEPAFETACAGAPGWSVYVFSSEHGQSAAYAGADEVRSAPVVVPMRGLFGGFNPVVEWRLSGDTAFATIQRYTHYTPAMDGTDAEQVQTLVVTALTADGACLMGHVDASRVVDANQAARDLADREGPGWVCGAEPVAVE